MASLFGKNKLKEVASKLSTTELEDKIAIIRTWHNDYHNGSLKKDKETSREQSYNQDFFIKILGYREKPAVPYSLEPKATTEKGQLPDAVLSYTDATKGIVNIAAVVELKGATIELDRPQRRDGNMSPVQQGFKYKTQYRNCPFVIVGNFWEFRLYNDNQLDYELWTLDGLIDPADDYLQFKTFYTLLQHENFTTAKGASKTEDLLTDIRIQQETIGRKFYKVYHNTRLTLLRDIYAHNISIKTDIDTGIEKAQKIIDRIVFACFAEDRGLLPDNTLQRVVKAADSSAFGGSLWSTFKGFFEAIDVGSIKLEIPDGYNGGLFARDDVLNNLEIGDDALRAVASLSTYNFNEDLSVNILGHIFEQSISDLEEIKNKVNESHNLDSLSQSRRKKDGIFYTPDYIVRYIVENSLGIYLREREEKFKEEFKLHDDIQDKTYSKREQLAYSKYQGFLQNVKVLDPACGSGAFLVHVFDYLLTENKRVNSILGNSLFSSDDYVKSILQNNIYGVDLNEESVEITKLSLWLKSAQKGKKLTALDDNVKCGNSLIDDPSVAGVKAFDWYKEFANIMQNGGFDVVVMNPPYVFARENFKPKEKEFYVNSFSSAKYQINTYLLFIEQTIKLVKNDGYYGMIVPNSWLMVYSGENLRKILLETSSIIQIVNLSGYSFENVSVETVILTAKKTRANADHQLGVLLNDGNAFYLSHKKKQENFKTGEGFEFKVFTDDIQESLNLKISHECRPLDELTMIKAGLQAYEAGKGTPAQTPGDVKERPYDYTFKYDDNTWPYLEGKDVMRYMVSWSGLYLRYGDHLASPRNFSMFSGEKIIIREITGVYPRSLMCAYSDETYLFNRSNIAILEREDSDISLKYIIAILNSTLMSYYFQNNTAKSVRKMFPKIILNDLRKFPIKKISLESQRPFIENSDTILRISKELYASKERFQKLVLEEFGSERWPTKLNKWWTLDFTNFISILKLNLSLQQKDELLSLFEKYRTECSELDDRIKRTDQEIDQLVYELYDLTPEDVTVIEKGL